MIVTTRGWSGAEIVWTHASGAATYSVDGNTLNAYDVAVALRAWLEDAARPWAAAIDTVMLAIEADADDERLRFVYSFTGGTPTFTSKAPNATWIAMFGDTSQSPPTGCRGSTSGLVASLLWERVSVAPGGRSRNGSWRMEPASSSLRRPNVRFVGTPGQSEALSVAIRAASQPRQAYIRDEATDTWRLVTLGEVGPMEHPDDDDVSLVTGPIQAYGGV
ncbi:MAG: hypothetical protein IT385_19000 [Deltaproteobacteria bacterium]|nr:hypothetical protein [Deltaproteobacteria bacterium]